MIMCEPAGPVAVVTLDRPAVRNALNGELVERLTATLRMLDADPAVHAVVLTGSPPGFCAGSDLKELAAMPVDGKVAHEAATGTAVRAFGRLDVPLVAAVEGFAMGGGFLLAAACDVVVTASDTRWLLPEVALGWVPPWGLQALIDRAGPALARRLAFGERPLTGRELHRLGVVDELAEPGGAPGRAREIADRLAALPPHAVASVKRVFADAAGGAAAELDARATAAFGADSTHIQGRGAQ